MSAPVKTHLPRNLGRVLETSDAAPLTLRCEQGVMRVQFYSPTVVRVEQSPELPPDDFSYAVIARPAGEPAPVHESASHIALQTEGLRTVINRANASVAFYTLAGQVINEDEPGLSTSWIGDQVTCYKKLQPGERFIGLGEKTGHLDRRGSGYTNWNTDAYAYHAGTDPLYSAMPFYIGLHNGLVYGIFFDNSYKSYFNFGASNNRFASFGADGGRMNYYFIYGQSVAGVIDSYTALTGRMPLPPLWSIGYQQCRYSYYPDKEVLTLAQTFREKNFPADVVVLDIHYMDHFKIFTWHPSHFANPSRLIEALKEKGFQVVIMCDPGIKTEPGYAAYDSGLAADAFIKYPDGQNFTAQVWPGWCHFPDFSKPAARQWWKEQFEQYVSLGIEGFWNDMNELATWGNFLPDNVLFDFEGRGATMREARNLYGFLMARSTYEAARAWMKNRRPFNLSRSGFSGIQRYAALWTGDNVSYDEHMLLGVRIVNSLGLTGVAFTGYDAGGFVGNASPKLFARWMSVAALSPFFRGHTMINTADSEPWSYGEEVENITRNYIRLRYQLMPYIYSLFYEASVCGMPVQRSLAIEFPFDERVYDHRFENQYLFGPAMLVAPVESNKEITRVYLPPGHWYDLYNGARYEGSREIFIDCPLHRLPVFVRAGSIIPMKNAGRNTFDLTDELHLHLYAGEGRHVFLLYEDDGVSFDYRQGVCSLRNLQADFPARQLLIGGAEGAYVSPVKNFRVFFHGFSGAPAAQVNDKHLPVKQTEFSLFTPLDKYDPLHPPASMGSETVWEIEFEATAAATVVRW